MNGRATKAAVGIVVLLTMLVISNGAAADRPARDYNIALGDSVAAGQGATVPDRFGYVGLFQHFYRVDNRGTERFDNLAVHGETSSSLLGDQMDRAVDLINDPGTEVQVVTLTVGANDFLPLLRTEPCASDPTGTACRQAVGNALGSFAVNYQAALTRLFTALDQDPGEGRVLITTYYNPFDGTGASVESPVDAALLGVDGTVDCTTNASAPDKVGLNDIIACTGEQVGADIVDIYPLFSDSAPTLTHISEDDIHPNDAGHDRIADAVISAYQDG